ncbi:MAG: hypothetical protein ABI759_00490 [Candidatus Solibacter sp.]
MKLLAFAFAMCALAQDVPVASSAGEPETGPLGSFLYYVEQIARLGNPTPGSLPTVRDAVALYLREEFRCTDQETQALQAVAASYVRRVDLIRAPYGHLVFEARLEFADTGQESIKFNQAMKKMNEQLAEQAVQAKQQLKAALRDERFERLDAWVHSADAKRCVGGPCVIKR